MANGLIIEMRRLGKFLLFDVDVVVEEGEITFLQSKAGMFLRATIRGRLLGLVNLSQ